MQPADPVLLLLRGNAAANAGTDALRTFWSRLSGADKRAVGGQQQLDAWKQIAAARDAEEPAHA